MRAQQDHISIFGDPAEIFGPGEALETTLVKLRKAGFEPNRKKFKVFGTMDGACADKPGWLDKTPVVTDPVARARVEAAKAEAAAAAAAAAASPKNAAARPQPRRMRTPKNTAGRPSKCARAWFVDVRRCSRVRGIRQGETKRGANLVVWKR